MDKLLGELLMRKQMGVETTAKNKNWKEEIHGVACIMGKNKKFVRIEAMDPTITERARTKIRKIIGVRLWTFLFSVLEKNGGCLGRECSSSLSLVFGEATFLQSLQLFCFSEFFGLWHFLKWCVGLVLVLVAH